MLKVVATRATRMPASPAAWSSSSRMRLGDCGGGGVGGGGDVVFTDGGDGEVVFADGGYASHAVLLLEPQQPFLAISSSRS